MEFYHKKKKKAKIKEFKNQSRKIIMEFCLGVVTI